MARPGGWDRDVASVAIDAGVCVVLVDPLVDGWSELDTLVEGNQVAVVLTAPWHERSSSQVAERYGATVFVHRDGRQRVTCESVQAMTQGEVAPGVEVLPVAGAHDGEVVLWLPSKRALIAAEVLTGTSDGLRVAESPALRSRDDLWTWVRELAALPTELVLPSHGPPVLRDGRYELAAALERPPW